MSECGPGCNCQEQKQRELEAYERRLAWEAGTKVKGEPRNRGESIFDMMERLHAIEGKEAGR